MQELGLFHGKMGVVVALYLYADAYGDEVMREYAWELFQQVYDGVHTDMPVGLERGLAGIGYGTTLLCKRLIFLLFMYLMIIRIHLYRKNFLN